MDWFVYAMLGWLLSGTPAPQTTEHLPEELSSGSSLTDASRILGLSVGPRPWQLGWRAEESERLERRRWIGHVYRTRQRLSEVAARYGVTLAEVRRWNEEKVEAGLRPGMTLRVKARIVPVDEVLLRHRVGLWETWPDVAAQYRVDPRDLRAWNRGVDELGPGVVLDVWFDPGRPWTVYRRPGRALEAPEVRDGGRSVGRPHRGRLEHGVAVPESPHYDVVFPRLAWGSSHTVRNLVSAVTAFRGRSGYEGTVEIASLSREVGRRLPPHVSHQSGRDVDIRLPLLPTVPVTRRPNPDEIDWLATWALIESLLETGEVRYIFLDLPLQRRLHYAARSLGWRHEDLVKIIQWPYEYGDEMPVIRRSPGHDGHIHVRFKCGPDEPRCRNELPAAYRTSSAGGSEAATAAP